MLKFRIFLWRYYSYRENNSLLRSFQQAKQEANQLESHFQELKQKKVEPQKFWKTINFKQEFQSGSNILLNKVQNIQYPTINKQTILEFLKLYNLSIQALLEGKREVMQNDKFVFKDGQSLEQKINKITMLIQKITKQ